MKLSTVSTVAATALPLGKCIRREHGEFYGYYDQACVVYGKATHAEAERELDAFVYELLRRTSWETADNAADYAEVMAA
jgi:hypothetical protein